MVPARRRTPSTAARSSAGTDYSSAAPGLGLGQDVNAPAGPYANSSSYQTGLDNAFVIQPAMDASSQHQQSVDFNATLADSEIARAREDELDCKSESDNADYASGEERESNKRAKKKRYHRHTQHQIQVMEGFFKECPHPDDKQRKELSRELGLEPLQVKFWFQNKRTQMKTHHERQENQELRVENEKLRTENIRYRDVLANASCTNCGGPANAGEMSFEEQQLRVENVQLREEIEKMSALASSYIGRPVGPNLFVPLEFHTGNLGGPSNLAAAHNILTGEMTRTPVLGRFPGENVPAVDRPGVVQLAVNAMEELSRVAHAGEPLWTPGSEGNSEVLNQEEYRRAFPRAAGAAAPSFGMRAEATRENGVVVMSNPKLLDLLMDVNKWSMVFSSIVSRAATLEVLSTGVAGNYNGALQVMTAEFQMPSPLVPTRDSCFLRYCKKLDDDTWAVADVSLDTLHPNPLLRCRRRPSGCIIREMPNGYSKVIWVEHMEVDDRTVHRIYRPLVNSGLAFGAKRWISILDRQCERIASFISNSLPSGDASVITTQDGKRSMLNLAERMVISFCSCVGASIAHHWTTLSGTCGEDVRVMTRKSVDDPGRPPGIVLSASTSLWLPAPPRRVFDFLRNENNRSEWDILSNGGVVQEMARIDNGRDEGNCISLLRVNSPNANQSNMLILQESCTDATASFVVYAPVDLVSMNVVLNGGDPDYVALLPSGFAVLPDAHPGGEDSGDGDAICGSSLLTVAFQILVDSQPQAKLSLGSVATVNSLIACTIDRIRSSVLEHSQ